MLGGNSHVFRSINGHTKNATANIMKPPIRYKIATVFACIGIFGSVKLKSLYTLSEPSLLALLFGSVLLGLFIAYSDKVQVVDFSKGQLVLREIKASEDVVKRLAMLVAETTESSMDGAYYALVPEHDKKVRACIEEIRKIAHDT
jgi:hypothetical protein